MNKKLLTYFQKLNLAFWLLLVTFHLNAQNYCNSTPVAVHGSLSVQNAKIVDKNNNPVSFAGNSFFWSNTGWGAEKYYNADVVNWLANDWNSTIVRAAMGVEDNGGYLNYPTENKNRVKTVVDAAIAKGLYVIIDWHSHHAENNQQAAIEFFEEMAQTYGSYPNVIYEIYNEPLQVSWSNTIKPYANAVISAIRNIDPDNLIIVGTPTWSQDVDVASTDPINANNIAYTLHFYAATHKQSLRQKAQTALNNGIALMVTEWGSVQANGSGAVDVTSTNAWMNFLQENDITHANWSITDKNEGAAALVPGASASGGWSSNMLTASGSKVKSIIQNWEQYCGSNGNPSDNTPIVSIISPSVNDSFSENTAVTVTASATDPDGSITEVEFFANGNSIGIATSNPYTVNWNPSEGNYNLTAVAMDNQNQTTTSEIISVTVTGSGVGVNCANLPVWNSQAVYAEAGIQVVYNGNIYQNNWYSNNQNPDNNSGPWQVWSLVSPCSSAAMIAEQEFSIFPNPSNANFKIQLSDTASLQEIVIYNLQGQLLFTQEVHSGQIPEFSLANYADGMYVVKFRSGSYFKTKYVMKKSN